MEATVFVPSDLETKSDGSGFTPMLFDKFGEKSSACDSRRQNALTGLPNSAWR